MNIKYFDELPSTHNWVKENPDIAGERTMICARNQTSGRGQRGNSWEAEPGKNLSFTFRFTPQGVAPRRQFAISEAVALAVKDMLGNYGIVAKVKWPNDIYVDDCKICGILIDHELYGSTISSTVASAGINVNQKVFLSDAPNPVSMTQLKGEEYALEKVAIDMAVALEIRLPQTETEEGRRTLHEEFMKNLWRGDGDYHPFRIVSEGRDVQARILDVAPDGILTLLFDDGTSHSFAFKEVEFLGKKHPQPVSGAIKSSRVTEVTDLSMPELQVYSALTEAQLRNRLCPENAIFIAESPKVIRVALDAGYKPVSILCERKHIDGDAADIIARCDAPAYTGSRELLASLTGYKLTRGVLCAMKRPSPAPADKLLKDARRVVVIDGVTDTTNIGAIFRSAAALGMDAVLLTPQSCDPLNRRSVRVSMGSVFLVPWTWIDDPVNSLRKLGFSTAAMALRKDSVSLTDAKLKKEKKLAIIMGTEGDGLADSVISSADYTVMIPMAHGVDSLNVAAASAVAFWELGSIR